jgi:hypothetical protein
MIVSDTVKSEQYWEEFSLLPADFDYLVNYLVENESPQTLDELTRVLITYRHEKLVSLMEDTFSRGKIYQPAETYEVGEQVIFPHMGSLVGEVTSVRPGRNPEYEPFSVIHLQMKDGSERQFAAELTQEHPLNEATYVSVMDVSPEELYARHSAKVKSVLQRALEQAEQFVSVAHQWFIRDLMVDVSTGQLNIAEAMLDMNQGGPLPTEDFLTEIELPAEIPEELRIFSLEYALMRDKRFDEVGPTGQGVWYLRRMEPKGVLEIPEHLRYIPIPYNRALLDEVMLSLERQIDDEWSEVEIDEEEMPADEEETTVILSYPHWRSGTLPLTYRLAQLFPTARITDRIRFTFVDRDTEESFPGWVVRSNRYVYGLADWYDAYKIAPGAYIDLWQGEEPGVIEVGVRQFRSRRGEWLRTVTVDDGRLSFEVTRVPVTCEFDELAAIAVPDPEAVDALADQFKKVPLPALVDQIFRGLAVLSLQRAVHAMTLYAVVNLVRRVPPAPLMAVLATVPQFTSLGNNYWAYRGDE